MILSRWDGLNPCKLLGSTDWQLMFSPAATEVSHWSDFESSNFLTILSLHKFVFYCRSKGHSHHSSYSWSFTTTVKSCFVVFFLEHLLVASSCLDICPLSCCFLNPLTTTSSSCKSQIGTILVLTLVNIVAMIMSWISLDPTNYLGSVVVSDININIMPLQHGVWLWIVLSLFSCHTLLW